MSYVRFYDSPVLDDLHNYFPQILYAPENFQNIGDLLFYVQQQTRSRFDLFSRGRRDYFDRTRIISTPPRRQDIMVMQAQAQAAQENSYHTSTASDTLMATLLAALAPGFPVATMPIQQTMGPAFLDPVAVRPTPQQINAATTIEVVDSDDETCSICQDTMAPGSNALSLTACDHRFHEGCIRTWLNSSVHCPICRHDIREPANSSQ